jgi:hypothetical protein
MHKEYLETTFPDGTPVKIYPVKETLTQELYYKSQEKPGIINGVLNAIFYKDLVVVSNEKDIPSIRKDNPSVNHFIISDGKWFKWQSNER